MQGFSWPEPVLVEPLWDRHRVAALERSESVVPNTLWRQLTLPVDDNYTSLFLTGDL
jgi:hypothetical protein